MHLLNRSSEAEGAVALTAEENGSAAGASAVVIAADLAAGAATAASAVVIAAGAAAASWGPETWWSCGAKVRMTTLSPFYFCVTFAFNIINIQFSIFLFTVKKSKF